MSHALKNGKKSLSLRRENSGPVLNGGKTNRTYRKNRNWKEILLRQFLSKLCSDLLV